MWKLSDVKSKIVRTGLILQAIREDEIAVRTLAINTITFKIVVFSVSGFFAGIAGGLYAHTMRVVGPSTLELWNSIQPILWTLFGGICSIHGPVLGAVFLYPLTEFLRIVPQFRLLIFALVMILIVLFMPEGLGVWVRDKLEEECPRCKLTNASWRRYCRACGAPIHLER
jgi:branched-chain amino acid transport system permease protein